jgi:hypothetical protein
MRLNRKLPALGVLGCRFTGEFQLAAPERCPFLTALAAGTTGRENEGRPMGGTSVASPVGTLDQALILHGQR